MRSSLAKVCSILDIFGNQNNKFLSTPGGSSGERTCQEGHTVVSEEHLVGQGGAEQQPEEHPGGGDEQRDQCACQTHSALSQVSE